MPSFAAETFLNMDTSSGSPTLDGPLTSTLSYGSSSNNTGYFFLVPFKYLNEECSFFFLKVGFYHCLNVKFDIFVYLLTGRFWTVGMD